MQPVNVLEPDFDNLHPPQRGYNLVLDKPAIHLRRGWAQSWKMLSLKLGTQTGDRWGLATASASPPTALAPMCRATSLSVAISAQDVFPRTKSMASSSSGSARLRSPIRR